MFHSILLDERNEVHQSYVICSCQAVPDSKVRVAAITLGCLPAAEAPEPEAGDSGLVKLPSASFSAFNGYC